MRNAPRMHQLHDDLPALGMHGVGGQPPTADMLGSVESRDAAIAEPVGRGRGPLGDDQAGRGALRVVLRHQGVRGIVIDGTTARHRRHDDAVVELQRADTNGIEEHEDLRKDEKVDKNRSGRALAGDWIAGEAGVHGLPETPLTRGHPADLPGRLQAGEKPLQVGGGQVKDRGQFDRCRPTEGSEETEQAAGIAPARRMPRAAAADSGPPGPGRSARPP